MEEGKMMRLRNEKASVVGADGVRAGVEKTELRGRQGAQHSDLAVSFPRALGSQRCHHLAALPHSAWQGQDQRPRGRLGWHWWMREVHTDMTSAQEALVMLNGGVREKVVRNTKEL